MKNKFSNETNFQSFRLSVLAALIIIGSCSLILRLAYLQFSQYKMYATLSLKNQMGIIPMPPPRGLIVDKHGVVLADNIPIYVLEIIPEHVLNLKDTLARLQKLLPSINPDDLENFHRLRHENHSYVPIPLKLKLSQEDLATFASNQYQFPGVSIKARLMRYYPHAELTAHLLGYVGRINLKELKEINYTNYQGTNYIGKTGVESFYEEALHGKIGYQQIETDASGRTIRTLSKQLPISGSKITLSIDFELQKRAYAALKEKRGAAVVIDVHNGEVLAMVSAPSFDPNLFVNGVSHDDYAELSNAFNRPLFNRAVRGLYPPASTVKPFIALAGLDKSFVSLDTKIYDPGWFQLPNGKRHFRDWKKTGHGAVSIKRAVTVSCDTFFYQLGAKMGINLIEDILKQFGFGQLTHIDLHEESPGLVPNPSWKKRTKGVSWYPGDTLITTIGQGFMLVTPLQLASAAAALSLHGQRFQPHLVKYLTDDHNNQETIKVVEEYPIKLKNNQNWGLIIDAMRAVITDNEGTGYRFGRRPSYTVAAKTGTAQVFSLSQIESENKRIIPEELRDHSWFMAFAPIEEPEIAVAVLVENDVIAPQIARTIMDGYFELSNLQKNPIKLTSRH